MVQFYCGVYQRSIPWRLFSNHPDFKKRCAAEQDIDFCWGMGAGTLPLHYVVDRFGRSSEPLIDSSH